MSKTYKNKPDTPRFDYPILKKGGRHEKPNSAHRKQAKQKLKSGKFDQLD